MDLDAILRLMDRAEQSPFMKVEVQQGDLRILLERGAPATSYQPTITEKEFHTSAEPVEKDAVCSPISGVFYLRKEPGAEPFVLLGSKVSKGDTLCIIEAMKTMNEIRAPRGGVISGICAEDGATISAGDILFLLGEGN